jgi:hypothetical protein
MSGGDRIIRWSTALAVLGVTPRFHVSPGIEGSVNSPVTQRRDLLAFPSDSAAAHLERMPTAFPSRAAPEKRDS